MFKVQFLYAQILLIPFSSFLKDVILPPNPKLTGMTNTRTATDEIIVTGFGDTQTAFLALATLARLQRELEMATDDLALVLREADGSIAVRRTLLRGTVKNESSTRWVGARVGLLNVKNQALAERINLHLALGGSF